MIIFSIQWKHLFSIASHLSITCLGPIRIHAEKYIYIIILIKIWKKINLIKCYWHGLLASYFLFFILAKRNVTVIDMAFKVQRKWSSSHGNMVKEKPKMYFLGPEHSILSYLFLSPTGRGAQFGLVRKQNKD